MIAVDADVPPANWTNRKNCQGSSLSPATGLRFLEVLVPHTPPTMSMNIPRYRHPFSGEGGTILIRADAHTHGQPELVVFDDSLKWVTVRFVCLPVLPLTFDLPDNSSRNHLY